MMFAASAESPHPLRYVLPLDTWLPLHASASGLAILAFLPDQTRNEILSGPLTATTERTRVDTDRPTERLATIRRDGYALSHDERIPGAIAIAAPVFGLSGHVLGDVGITIPENRFTATSMPQLAALATQSAATLTEHIGGTQPVH